MALRSVRCSAIAPSTRRRRLGDRWQQIVGIYDVLRRIGAPWPNQSRGRGRDARARSGSAFDRCHPGARRSAAYAQRTPPAPTLPPLIAPMTPRLCRAHTTIVSEPERRFFEKRLPLCDAGRQLAN
jgi:hypothetical protein